MWCACEFCWSRWIAGLINLNMKTSSSRCAREDLNRRRATSMVWCLYPLTTFEKQGLNTHFSPEVRLSLRSRHFKSSTTTITMSPIYRSHQTGVIRVDAINHMYTQECLISDSKFLHNTIVQNGRLFVLTWRSLCVIICSNLVDIFLNTAVMSSSRLWPWSDLQPHEIEKHNGFQLLDYTSIEESIDRSNPTHWLSVPKRHETAWYHCDNIYVALSHLTSNESRTHRTRRRNKWRTKLCWGTCAYSEHTDVSCFETIPVYRRHTRLPT